MGPLRFTWGNPASRLELIFVPGTQGRPYSFGEESVRPAIEVPDFFLATVVVTNDLWAHVMQEPFDSGIAPPPPRQPRLEVSWDHLTAPVDGFLARLNAGGSGSSLLSTIRDQAPAPYRTNGRFRLPSETEWEYAARGGPHWRDGYRFSGGNDIELVAWYQLNSGDRNHDVALKEPNQLGLYDMCGNVWEWCQDAFTPDLAQIPTDGSPFAGGGAAAAAAAIANAEDERVLRGGCHHNWAIHCTVAKRYAIGRAFHDGCIGFRLAFS